MKCQRMSLYFIKSMIATEVTMTPKIINKNADIVTQKNTIIATKAIRHISFMGSNSHFFIKVICSIMDR
jgi:hypothetical protein